ncbi:MAG TPA: hypothetical protein VL361_22260 [Candidatus Limnocylindrales bacterium]|nr:hypothetical protein [Candidatus Limnocylindrales bacterium]
MKPKHPLWIASAVFAMALVASSAWSETITNVIARPGAIQPNGDANDTTRNFGIWWNDNGAVTEDLDFNMHSQANIPASLHVVYDCAGGTVEPIKSANLAFGNFFSSLWGDNNWLGAANTFDAAKFQSLNFDIYINNAASSNTSLSIRLYGHEYGNVGLTNLPLTLSGWQHLEIPIPSTISLSDCTGYGIYDWYNTTASTPPAHVEYWMDNVMLVARTAGPPPPTLTIAPVTDRGLLFDSGPGEGGQRGAIHSASDVRWSGYATPASPVTYSMTISKVPDPAICSNYEAHIFLAPNGGVGNPDWNLSDMGYLQILNHNDGTATARMMWKTNDPMNNDMLFGAGTLGYLDASTMIGTWSITFTSDTDLVVRGPGDVSATFSLPLDWVNNYNNVGGGNVYAYFGGSPNGNDNAGHPMYLSRVSITGTSAGYNFTNDFTNPLLDSTRWALLGNETVQVAPSSTWWLSWTLPAAGFDLWAKESLNANTPWIRLSGNTNLPVPVTTYTRDGEMRVLVAGTSLPNASQTFFAARKLVASKLQVLMPGETNAPFTATGKIGTPTQQLVGNYVTVTVNAVDSDWNIVAGCADTVHLTSIDAGATLPADAALANGTGNFDVLFGTTGPQTVTANDVTTPAVSTGTSSTVTIANP